MFLENYCVMLNLAASGRFTKNHFMRHVMMWMILSLILSTAGAQNISAKYRVVRTVHAPMPGDSNFLIRHEFTAYFYQQNNRTISYLMQRYEGKEEHAAHSEDSSAYPVYIARPEDGMEMINYIDFSKSSYKHWSHLQKFEQDFELPVQYWQLTGETRVIGKMTCRKATYTKDGRLIKTIWYCPEIPAAAGPLFTVNVPGFVADMEELSSGLHFYLESVDTMEPVTDLAFKLDELSEITGKRGHVIKSN